MKKKFLMRSILTILFFVVVIISPVQRKIFAAGETEMYIDQGSITISSSGVTGKDKDGKNVNAALNSNGYIIKQTNNGEVPVGNSITVDGGVTANISIENININPNQAFKIIGNATVNLSVYGVNNLTSSSTTTKVAGLEVLNGSTLRISGTGKLSVFGTYYGAGIGSNPNYNNEHTGTIIINGGIIEAHGGNNGAGIGGGCNNNCGNITINGGVVTAYAGDGAAAIGNGYLANDGTIIVNGGTITTSGGYTGIGSGDSSNNSASITINGGTVKANGMSVQPTSVTSSVYLTTVSLPVSGFTSCSVSVNNIDFHISDPHAGDGKLYLYLPAGLQTIKVIADGATYYKTVTISPNNNNVITLVQPTQPTATDSSITTTVNTPVSGTVVATDVNGDSLTYNLMLLPSKGTITFNSTGSYIYLPNPNIIGVDSFMFYANDGTDNSNNGTVSISITAKSIAGVTIDSIADQIYTGLALTPEVTVKDGTTVLEKDTDYTVTYAGNTNAGAATATVTITGKGNYTGTISKKFTITEKALTGLSVDNIADQTYTGSVLTPTVTVKDGTTVLVKDTDYTVLYTNNINIGKATVTITGKGNYTGSITKDYKIVKSMAGLTVDNIADQTYTGSALTPSVIVKDGTTVLEKDTDYTVAYTGNINSGTATATVTITGKGNYTGAITKNFTITAKPMTGLTVESIEDQTYTGSALTPNVTVKDGTRTLVKDTDYTVAYAGNTNTGTAAVTITGKENYTGKITKDFSIILKQSTSNISSQTNADTNTNTSVITAKPEPLINVEQKEEISTVTLMMTVPVDQNTERATVKIDNTAMDAVIDKVKSEQATGQKVKLEIKLDLPVGIANAQLIISSDSFKKLSSLNNPELIVRIGKNTITFNSSAIGGIGGTGLLGDVAISVNKIDGAALPSEEKNILGNRPIYDFLITAGGNPITSFNGETITISMAYTPNSSERYNSIVPYYIENIGGKERLIVMNGAYNPVSGMVKLTTTHLSRYAIGYNEINFNDVAKDSWYNEAVSFIAARGITTGTSGGKYSPAAKLTRGQFLVMVMRAYNIEPDTNIQKKQEIQDNFSDAGNTYYTEYLAAAKRLGICAGIGNNKFAPEKQITREEMAALLYNILKSKDLLPMGVTEKSLFAFSDAGDIDSWAKDAMTLLVATGTISGSNSKLSPKADATRAEMAQLIYNLISK